MGPRDASERKTFCWDSSSRVYSEYVQQYSEGTARRKALRYLAVRPSRRCVC